MTKKRYLKEQEMGGESEPEIMQLNREVDKVLNRSADLDSPAQENIYDDDTLQDLAKRIDRCCNDIRSTLAFIISPETKLADPTSQLSPLALAQDYRISNLAKQLLKNESKVLFDLIDAVVNKDDDR